MLKIFMFFLLLGSSLCIVSSQETVQLVTVEFPPYSFSENGDIKGIQVEIIKEIFRLEGIDYSLEILPFPRGYEDVLAGRKDFLFNFYKNPERLKLFDYTDVIIENPLVIFHRKDMDLVFTGNLDELSDYVIGNMIGYTYSPEFDEAKNSGRLNVVDSSSHEINFRMLNAGRIDLYIVERNVGIYVANSLGFRDNFEINSIPLIVQHGFMGTAKDNPNSALIERINSRLKELKDSGFYQSVFDKYLER